MSTLRDLAKYLSLSPATVSRALNGFPEVNEQTRARVVEAARRLDYRPNQLAQKLVTGRSNLVGLIVSRPRSLARDTTFFGVVGGISAALAARNVDLVLHAAADDDLVEPYRRLVGKGILDGFILSAPQPADPRIAYLAGLGVPFVVHGRGGPDASYPYFDIDNGRVSRASVDLLCDLGHARIALITGPPDHAYAIERRDAFVSAMANRGAPVPPAFIIEAPLSETHGYTAALRALGGTLGPPPTAFVCASMAIAAGVYHAATDRGLRIPEDIAVIAHDDDVPQYPADEFLPSLTTTRAALTDACEPLAEILIARIEQRADVAMQRRVLPELIVRRSTGAVRQGEGTPWAVPPPPM